MQDVTSGVRDKRYRWSSAGEQAKHVIKSRQLKKKKWSKQKKLLLSHVFLKWWQRLFIQNITLNTSKTTKPAVTHFFFPNDSSATARKLVKRMTSSFLCSLMIRGHYASLALWFLKPFLCSTMSFSTWGHPRRQSLYEAERQAFEALAPGLSARCCNTWAPMLLIDSQRYY